MADITVGYKGSTIAEISTSGTTTLGTSGKYCEDDITLQYVKPSAPTPTNMISNGDFSQAGATTDGWSSTNVRATVGISDGRLVLTHTTTSNITYGLRYDGINLIQGHKYMVKFKLKKTMNDDDGDSKVVDVRFATQLSDLVTAASTYTTLRRINVVQDTIIEQISAFIAEDDYTCLGFIFGGAIATAAANESMLELYYVELYDITDIVDSW